ncbi:MAG: hypothetical protein KDI18_16820 [Gammaproteobacteria bacterium]|nr:hypothetical protein [Gammaproteobacteria bacterium]MCP5410481.1 hypothetical protein [Chromatiaceae bacterium]MCP5443740.1 hypothetical protein [Chromatiaceae bacterium]
MESCNRPTLSITAFCECTLREDCDLAICTEIGRLQEALRLTQLGARAGLVSQLTGMEKTAANRLYRRLHGKLSPSGLMPFTDAWYLKCARRMLHASQVWHLHKRLAGDGRSPGRTLIDVYECYTQREKKPLLDLTRTFLVPRLVTMNIWREHLCRDCGTHYPAPDNITENRCAGCRIHYRFRCRNCQAPVPQSRGRPRARCDRCGTSLKQSSHRKIKETTNEPSHGRLC